MGSDALRPCPFCEEPDFDAIGLRAHLRECATHLAVPSKAAETRAPSEPGELERVLAWLEGHAAANNAVGATKTGAEYAHVASVVRAMAADFDRLGNHAVTCGGGKKAPEWRCSCGYMSARERWRVKP